MTYADFTFQDAVTRFRLGRGEWDPFPPGSGEEPPSDLLRAQLDRGEWLSRAIGTEKAKAEFVTAPILAEVWHRLRPRVSLFSGIELPVDPSRGLTGTCDFILSHGHEQEFLTAPALIVTEARDDNLNCVLGVCAAGMVAAHEFNAANGRPIPTVYGAVTSGNEWRFLRLRSGCLDTDRTSLHVSQIGAILGALLRIMQDAA